MYKIIDKEDRKEEERKRKKALAMKEEKEC